MTDDRRRMLDTPEGPYVVYHRDTAGLPNAHQHPGGPWYFQPSSYSGDVYSKGYPSPEAASEAAWAWVQQLQDEEREAAPLPEENLPDAHDPVPQFTTATDARTFVLNSGVLDWEWGSAASWEDLARWLWQHHSDEDLPRDRRAWWDECLRRYLVSVGEDPADYSLGGMQQLTPTPGPERQR